MVLSLIAFKEECWNWVASYQLKNIILWEAPHVRSQYPSSTTATSHDGLWRCRCRFLYTLCKFDCRGNFFEFEFPLTPWSFCMLFGNGFIVQNPCFPCFADWAKIPPIYRAMQCTPLGVLCFVNKWRIIFPRARTNRTKLLRIWRCIFYVKIPTRLGFTNFEDGNHICVFHVFAVF